MKPQLSPDKKLFLFPSIQPRGSQCPYTPLRIKVLLKCTRNLKKVNPDFTMFTGPPLFSLKKAKVYLKMADIDIGGTRRTAFHPRQILCRGELLVLFYRSTHSCGQYFRSFF
jgi:hypothetical protein